MQPTCLNLLWRYPNGSALENINNENLWFCRVIVRHSYRPQTWAGPHRRSQSDMLPQTASRQSGSPDWGPQQLMDCKGRHLGLGGMQRVIKCCSKGRAKSRGCVWGGCTRQGGDNLDSLASPRPRSGCVFQPHASAPAVITRRHCANSGSVPSGYAIDSTQSFASHSATRLGCRCAGAARFARGNLVRCEI